MSWSPRKVRKRPRKKSCCFKGLGWLMRRQAVWQTLYGWHRPWMRPGVADLFLSKSWKSLECSARKEFAYDGRKRWQE